MPELSLSVVVVTYNGKDFVRRCLASLLRSDSADEMEILVVDNGSTDGTPGMVQSEYPRVKLVALGVNRGFAAANNTGICSSSGKFILLLNPDTEVGYASVSQTVRFLQSHPDVAIAGCRLILPDGKVQQSVRSFPSVWGVFAEAFFLYLLFWNSRQLGRYYMGFFDYGSSSPVDWLSGAFFMIRREVIERVGMLDERFFMYSEEMDYCLRARQKGLSTWYVAEAEIHHFWGGLNDVSRRSIVWTNGSQMLYFRKHFRGLSLACILGSKVGGMCVRLPLYIVAGALTGRGVWLAKARHLAAALPLMFDRVFRYDQGDVGAQKSWPT
jgi:GT2 family glycosyltransferase